MLAFHIGEEKSEYLRVAITRDNGDGWLASEVDISVGGFRAKYSADFNPWAFSDFFAQLEGLYRTVSGTAQFTSYDRQLELTLSCDGTGHILVLGEAMDYAGTGNRLSFHMEVDQTYVPAILRSLRAAVERYPGRAV
jgi:hypothetical protein